MLDGFYKENSKVLKFDVNKDIDKIRFNHYISQKENLQRIKDKLPRGQFYLTIRNTSTDLNITFGRTRGLIKEFIKNNIISNVYTPPKGCKNPSIWQYNSAIFANNEDKTDDCTDKPKNTNGLGGLTNTDVSTDVNTSKKENLKENLKKDIYSQVIDYLNEKVGTHYRLSTKSTQKLFNARYEDGYSLEDFKNVIDKKCIEWINTKFEKYLTPATLFKEANFEKYLNQKIEPGTTKEDQPVNRWAGQELPDS